MQRDAALALLDAWVDRAWLRALDRAVARFIADEVPDASGITLMAAALASHQLGRSHICLDLKAAEQDLDGTLALLGDEAPGSTRSPEQDLRIDATEWQNTLAADRDCVGAGAGNTPLVLDGHRVYLRRYWQYEQTVNTLARERLAKGLLTIVTGGPGTGKTTSVMQRVAKMQGQADNALRVALAAPTGKAAARLHEEATTLHRLLGRRPGSRHFRHDAQHPLPHDVVVVDEASMVDIEMTAQLLQALKPDARLMLLGDKDQLSSVEAGAVMADLCEVGGEHVTTLTHSHRFGERPGIGALASAVNAGDTDTVRSVWNAGFDHVARAPASDFERVVIDEGYRAYAEQVHTGTDAAAVLSAFAQFQLLCALRAGNWGVEGLNLQIETLLARRGLLDTSTRWYHGRPVMVTRNDYGLGLMNGDIGVTLHEDGKPWVWFKVGDTLKRVLPSRLTEVETVFAMTVHKSQGSEFAHTALILPDRPNPILTRELLYTGITRARDRFTLILSEDGVLDYALGRRTQRASGLADRLRAQPPA